MRKKILWITETAVLTALLVLLQTVTKAGGQFITGSCVNAVLAVAVLFSGLWSGMTVAALSPFLAFVLGIGPQLIQIIPAIALGNLVYVFLLWLITKGCPSCIWRRGAAWLAASCAKALTLYLIVVQLLCRILPLAEKQIATFTAMFSWPQLVTALIGGAVAMLIVPVLRKALKR